MVRVSRHGEVLPILGPSRGRPGGSSMAGVSDSPMGCTAGALQRLLAELPTSPQGVQVFLRKTDERRYPPDFLSSIFGLSSLEGESPPSKKKGATASIFDVLKNFEVFVTQETKKFSLDMARFCASEEGRFDMFNRLFSYSVPSAEVILRLNHLISSSSSNTFRNASRLVLEVGAGTGLWSRLLHENGVENVIATDLSPRTISFFHVEKMDAVRAVRKYNPNILFMCWIPEKAEYDRLVREGMRGGRREILFL